MNERNELNVTPGEWVVDAGSLTDRGCYWRVIARDRGGRFKGVVSTSDMANAHLMAASKELYAALVRANQALDMISHMGVGYLGSIHVSALQARIDAALAKARGES